jgi:hypothetical protein
MKRVLLALAAILLIIPTAQANHDPFHAACLVKIANIEAAWHSSGSPNTRLARIHTAIHAASQCEQEPPPPPPPATIQQMIDALPPEGGTVSLESRTYTESLILVTNRSNVTIDGNGATVQGEVGDGHRPVFRLTGGSSISFQELTLDGGYPNPGVHDPTVQWSHGIEILGTNGVVVNGLTIRNVAGDCVYAGKNESGNVRSAAVRVNGGSCIGTGRNGVSAVAVNDLRVQGGTYSQIGYVPFDAEPNPTVNSGVNGAVFDGATVGDYAGPVALGVVGDGPVDNITFSNLNVTAARGAVARVGTVAPRRRANITYTGITASNPTYTPDAIGVQRTDGVTVTGNTIPNGGGVMLVCTDVTSLTFTGNTPNTSAGCPAPPPPPPPDPCPTCPPLQPDIEVTNQTFTCDAPINVNNLTINITVAEFPGDATAFMGGCTGRIGNIFLTMFSGHDAVDFRAPNGGPHDLQILGGFVRVRGMSTGAHQDCIQMTNNTFAHDILMRNIVYSGCDTQDWIDSSVNVRNVICDGCTFLPEHSALVPPHLSPNGGPATAFLLTENNTTGTINTLVCIGSRFGRGVAASVSTIGWDDPTPGNGTPDAVPEPGSGNVLLPASNPLCQQPG